MHSRHLFQQAGCPWQPARELDLTTIRDYRPGDEEAILRAFNRVFAEQDADHDARSLARWKWQYLANPAGARIKLAFSEDGEVLAQYAGQSRAVRAKDERLRISHCADSMVLAGERGLAKTGLFVRTGHDFARDYGGAGEVDDRWMWGFPVAAAQRIGERSLGYVTVRTQVALVLEPGAVLPRVEAARTACMAGVEYDAFFDARAAEYGAVGERGAAHLRWRYLEHPELDYTLSEARDEHGALTGYSVGRRAMFEGREVWMLCDWFAREAAWEELLAAAAAQACDLPIVLIVPPWCVDFSGLQDLGFRVQPTSLLMVGRSYDRRYDHRFWSSSWYYTLGDSDLV